MITDVTTEKENPYMKYMTPELAEVARKELGEEPKRRDAAMNELRYWLRNHRTIYSKSDDEFLLKFLRNTKFNVEKAKKKITKCYEIRQQERRWAAKTEENYNVMMDLLHQKRPLGVMMNFAGNYHENIVIVRPAAWDFDKFSVEYVATGAAHVAEIILRDPRNMINGFQGVCDCTGVTFSMVLQATPTLIYKAVNIVQNCMPVGVKGMHLMNAPSFVNKIIQIGKMFASQKMKSRLQIHEGADFSLCDIFPKEALPYEYGGTAGPSQKFLDELEEILIREKDYLLDDDKHGIDKFPENHTWDDDQPDEGTECTE